jgi:hypothetical protein
MLEQTPIEAETTAVPLQAPLYARTSVGSQLHAPIAGKEADVERGAATNWHADLGGAWRRERARRPVAEGEGSNDLES